MPEALVEAQKAVNLAGQDPVKDDLARKFVQKELDRLRRLRTPFEAEWADCSRAYDMLKVKQYYQGRSDLTLPTIANLVERLVPRVVRATVGRDDFFECVPERPEDQDKAILNRELLKSQLDRAGFRRKYSPLMRDTCIYGTGIWKQRWRYEVRPDNGQVLFDGPDGDPLDVMNVFVDPRAADFNKTNSVEYMALNYTEIRKFERLGVFANVEPALASNTGAPTSGELHRIRRDRAHGFMEEGLQPGFWTYHEFWGEFPLDAPSEMESNKTETVPCVIGILGGTHVVRLERNPFECQRSPYFKSVLVERTGEFYGISLVKKIMDLWIEQNDMRNQANDARSFAVCPVMLKPQTGQPDKKTSQRIFPGAVITAPAGTAFAAFPDVTTAAMKWEPVVRRDMEETVGAPAILDAQSQADSATEASIQHTESGVRIAGYAHAVEDIFLVPLLSFCHDLNKQYLTQETAVRIKGFKGFDFRPITPDTVAGNFTFLTSGASSMPRGAALAAEFLQTTDRMLVVEQTAPGTFDMTKWWETYMREVLDIPHPSLYIKGLKFQGRIPTVDEVHYMLSQGQRVEPDPRQDFAVTLPQYGAYLNQIRDVLPEDILRVFIEHLLEAESTAKQVLMAKMLMADQQRNEMAASQKPAGSNGGKSNAERDDTDRDGQGLSTARQEMKNKPAGGARK